MQVLPRQLPLIILAILVILSPAFVESSQEQTTSTSNHTGSTSNTNKVSSHLLLEITLHGFLLWGSFGLLMPIGILIIRMSNIEEFGRRLQIISRIHTLLQTLSAVLITVAAIMSIKNFSNSFSNNHQRLGIALYGLVWLQVLIGFLRPQRGRKGRRVWFFLHWILGTAVSLLGVISIYTGLLAYHDMTSRSIKTWTILFTTEISFIAALYLFQDKWLHMQKQGLIWGTKSSVPLRFVAVGKVVFGQCKAKGVYF